MCLSVFFFTQICGVCAQFDRPGTCPDTSGIFTGCVITDRNCFNDSKCDEGKHIRYIVQYSPSR